MSCQFDDSFLCGYIRGGWELTRGYSVLNENGPGKNHSGSVLGESPRQHASSRLLALRAAQPEYDSRRPEPAHAPQPLSSLSHPAMRPSRTNSVRVTPSRLK